MTIRASLTTPRKTNSWEERCYYVLFSLNGEPLKCKFGDEDGSNHFFVPWLNFEQEMADIERGLPRLALSNEPSSVD